MNVQIISVNFEYKNYEKNYYLLLFGTLFIQPFSKISYHALLSHPITLNYYSHETYKQKLLKLSSLP
ncbi:Uncharacterised protein [Salmonella enterica subsp. enterica]|uniref:Uncharacterized protein n=1 Tax=Salmonella enterica I TaxID=59201 RepID=A0A379WSC2_SALET|nr:Uncharacterised protein [Salmonella enterica subsp. enterica]